MEFEYKNGKPIVPVLVGYNQEIELTGIIDSGADYCTMPVDVCEYLGFKKINDIELNIPGGTLIAPIFKGMIAINNITKEVEIAGLSMPSAISIDSLIGRNFWGELDIYLLGAKKKLIIDI